MSPCELNAAITAVTNHLYTNMKPRDFNLLAVFLALLSKQMFTLEAMMELCDRDDHRRGDHRRHEHRHGGKSVEGENKDEGEGEDENEDEGEEAHSEDSQ